MGSPSWVLYVVHSGDFQRYHRTQILPASQVESRKWQRVTLKWPSALGRQAGQKVGPGSKGDMIYPEQTDAMPIFLEDSVERDHQWYNCGAWSLR